MKSKIKGYFYTGLISTLPVILTLYILNWVFSFVLSLVSNSVIAIYLRNTVEKTLEITGSSSSLEYLSGIIIDLTTIFIIILLVSLVGYTFQHVFFRKVAESIRKLFETAPLVKHIYSTIRQIVGIVSSDKTATYQKVVAVEYPRIGIYSIGFLTSEKNLILEKALGEEKMCNIFIPTSPNPTSGMFIIVPEKELIYIDIKVEDAIKLIISGGVIVPNDLEDKKGGKNETV